MSKKEGDTIDPLCFPNAEDYLNDFDTANQILLGSGSYGQVYKMTFKSNPNSSCAVKIVQCVNKKSYESALKEVQLNRLINIHPNIIHFDKIYAWSETIPVQKYFLVLQMKLADGSLKDLKDNEIKSNRKTFNDAQFINLVNQLLNAFDFLQKRELYHRDIKPENILYEIENEKILMRIADFGVSKALEHFKANNVKNTLVGTPLYLSPKLWEAYINGQYNDVKHNLEKSDVFSLGITLLQTYLLLSDQQISGLNDQKQNKLGDLLQQILNDKIKQLLQGMLINDEKQRFSWKQALISLNGSEKGPEQNTINGNSLGQNKEKLYAVPISYEKTIMNKQQTIKLKKIHQIFQVDAQDQIKGQITDQNEISIFTDNSIISFNFDGVIQLNKKVQQVKQICYTDQPKNLIALFENNTLCIVNEDAINPIDIKIQKGYITQMISLKEQNIIIGLSNGQSQILQVEEQFKLLNTIYDHTAQINLLFFDNIQSILVTSDITRIFSVRYILEEKFSYLKLDYVAQHVEIIKENQLIVNGQNLNELLILQIKEQKQDAQIKLEIKQTLNLQTSSVLSLINLSEKCLFVSTEKEIIIYDISTLTQDQNHLVYNEFQQNFIFSHWIYNLGYLITNDGQRVQKWEIDYQQQRLYNLNRQPYILTKKCCCCCVIM